jgi:hypothetical protein
VDPFPQLDRLSTAETDQLINMVSVQEPGSLGWCKHSITHGKSPW